MCVCSMQHVYYGEVPKVHILYNGDKSMQIKVQRWANNATTEPGASPYCGLCGPSYDDQAGDLTTGPNAASCSTVTAAPGTVVSAVTL